MSMESTQLHHADCNGRIGSFRWGAERSNLTVTLARQCFLHLWARTQNPVSGELTVAVWAADNIVLRRCSTLVLKEGVNYRQWPAFIATVFGVAPPSLSGSRVCLVEKRIEVASAGGLEGVRARLAALLGQIRWVAWKC